MLGEGGQGSTWHGEEIHSKHEIAFIYWVQCSSLNSDHTNFALIQYVHAWFHSKVTLCVPNFLSKIRAPVRVLGLSCGLIYPASPSRISPPSRKQEAKEPTVQMFDDSTKKVEGRPRYSTQVSGLSVGTLSSHPLIHSNSWIHKVMVYFNFCPDICSAFREVVKCSLLSLPQGLQNGRQIHHHSQIAKISFTFRAFWLLPDSRRTLSPSTTIS